LGEESWVAVHFEHFKEGCVADIDDIFHVHSDVNGLEGAAVVIWDGFVVEHKSHHPGHIVTDGTKHIVDDL